MNLYDLLVTANNGDSTSLYVLVEKFMPTIKKFSYELRYEEAETDLIICFIEFVTSKKCLNQIKKNDGAIVKYLYKVLYYKKIDLFRIHTQKKIPEIANNDYLDFQADPHNDIEIFELLDTIKSLTEKQKKVIILKYFHGYSDVEISKYFNISRQSINRTNRRAIEQLRKTYSNKLN